MAYISNKEWFIEVAKGNIPNHSMIHKFGRNPAVGSTYEPLTSNGLYQTPQVSGATTIRVKAGDANDTAAGSGAREITVHGLDATGAFTTETIATAGASASSATTTTWIRIYRLFVSASGTYANANTGSHSADIVLETTGGTEWARIDSTNFPKGQSQIGVYTVPLGKTAYLINYTLTTDSNKPVDFIFFNRTDILQTVVPYSAMRTSFQHVGVEGSFNEDFMSPGGYPALTDIGFMVKAATSADVSVNMEILLIDD